MTRRRSVWLLWTALPTVALVLTGCGSSDEQGGNTLLTRRPTITSGSTPSDIATTDAGIALPGGLAKSRSGAYTVTAPAGWGDVTDQAGTYSKGFDLVLLSSKRVSQFSNNLGVMTRDGDASVVAKELEKGRAEMASPGHEISDADDVQIAGVTAKGFTTKFEQKGVRVTARSYVMTRDGKVYFLTLSSSQDDAANALTAFGEITDSWKWS